MPARGPFLARAPLRSLSPVFGRREERDPQERSASQACHGERTEARAFGAIWILGAGLRSS